MPDCTNIMALTEQHSGLRLCKKCNKLLPLDHFNPDKRRFMCKMHLRALRLRMVLGTQEKRAFNSLRCRARQDQILLGHSKIKISRMQVRDLMTKEQIADFQKFCIIPRRPEEILSEDNVIVVTYFQRQYIMGKWKLDKDIEQYKRDLDYILAAPDYNASKI